MAIVTVEYGHMYDGAGGVATLYVQYDDTDATKAITGVGGSNTSATRSLIFNFGRGDGSGTPISRTFAPGESAEFPISAGQRRALRAQRWSWSW